MNATQRTSEWSLTNDLRVILLIMSREDSPQYCISVHGGWPELYFLSVIKYWPVLSCDVTLCDPPSESTSNRITALAEQGLSLCCWSSLPVSSCVFSESPLLHWLHFWLSQVCGSGGGCAGGCGGCADHLSPQPAPSPLLTASLSVPYDRPAPRAGESRQVAPSAAELPCRYIRQQHQRGKEEKRGPELPCRLTYIRQQHQPPPAGNRGENLKDMYSEDGDFSGRKTHHCQLI